MSCLMCGECCRYATLRIPGNTQNLDWLRLHGMGVEPVGEELLVRIPIACEALVDNKCSIYDTRPETCRNYRCPKNVMNDVIQCTNIS